MRAYIISAETGPAGLTIVDRPLPNATYGAAVVRIHAASLNYRDHMVVSGAYGSHHDARGRIPLSDGAGVVMEVGDGVTRVKVGDRVSINFFPHWIDGPATSDSLAVALGGASADGVLADYVMVPAEALVKLPDGLAFEAAACLPCAGLTAWYSLFEASSVQPGHTVVVQGTGGVSIFALQFAKAAGAHVIATTSSPAKLDRLKALGADVAIDTSSRPEWDRVVLETTSGRGADLIVDVGGPDTLAKSLSAVRTGGTVAAVGVLSGAEVSLGLIPILFKQVRLQGVFVGSRAMFERMNTAITQSRLAPVVDRVFGFDDVPAAFAHMASGRHFGKVVIAWDQ